MRYLKRIFLTHRSQRIQWMQARTYWPKDRPRKRITRRLTNSKGLDDL